jgi:UPF0716 protein FxsA
MLLYLFLLFTLLPLIELALLIYIGSKTSVLWTILLVLGTGVAGAALARWQGWRTVQRIRLELRAGRLPDDSLFDGLLILAAGLLLISPGVLTDILGLTLLVPPLRTLVKRRLIGWLRRNVRVTSVRPPFRAETDQWDQASDNDIIIDSHVIDRGDDP